MKDLCVIDWTAVAAWVQAVGSIGAIAAAIWIGNRQHRQNIELVEKERERTDELRARQDRAIGKLATDAIEIISPSLTSTSRIYDEVCVLVNSRKSTLEIETSAEHLKEEFLKLGSIAEVVLEQFDELKPIYHAAGPSAAIMHFHLTATIRDIARVSNLGGNIFLSAPNSFSLNHGTIREILSELRQFHVSLVEDLAHF